MLLPFAINVDDPVAGADVNSTRNRLQLYTIRQMKYFIMIKDNNMVLKESFYVNFGVYVLPVADG